MEEIKNYIGNSIKSLDILNCKNIAIILSDSYTDSYTFCICHDYNAGLYRYFDVPLCLESLELDKPYSFNEILRAERKYNLLCDLRDIKEEFELSYNN